MKITIAIQHGTMVPFTSQHFRHLREGLIADGFSDSSHQSELEYGGPTFFHGLKLVTLDAVTVYGLPYWRVRFHSVENPSRNP